MKIYFVPPSPHTALILRMFFSVIQGHLLFTLIMDPTQCKFIYKRPKHCPSIVQQECHFVNTIIKFMEVIYFSCTLWNLDGGQPLLNISVSATPTAIQVNVNYFSIARQKFPISSYRLFSDATFTVKGTDCLICCLSKNCQWSPQQRES